uniref:Vesicle transport protein USE1 n=3 Tax=Rhodnius TaxID=13248 RepID=T1HUS0_RHOPR
MNTYFQRIAFLKGVLRVHDEETPLDKVVALQLAPKGNNEDSKELHHFTNEAVGTQLREELLTKKSGKLKRRKTYGDIDKTEPEGSNDLDALLKYHHTMQEKIADDMLVLARNIKEQSLLAGNIIRNDSHVVEKSSALADKNVDQLKVHSDKLQENNKKTWQCWTWVL